MTKHNSLCPDYSSHYENAVEQLGVTPSDDGRVTADEDEAIIAVADAEYGCCEGH